MSTYAQIKLWGTTIGVVSLDDGATVARFQYTPDFAASGIEVSPITMPLSNRIYSFPNLAANSFHGLPGLLADSLPDKYGNALIDAWLATQGRDAASFNAIERLCYTGERGMGALEFAPASGPTPKESNLIEMDQLVKLASDVLTSRTQLNTHLANDESAMRDILRVGTSAGGARAKAVIAWNPVSNQVRSGQLSADKGFSYWLLKFDGVTNNRDKELNDPLGYGVIEYAYAQMANAAGITMSECRLFNENGRRHFMTRRFDRTDAGEKLHMQSLAGLAHFDFNLTGAYSYEQAFLTMRQLKLPMQEIEEQFRRMVFNVVARNQDDHVKNIAYLMDKSGRWSLAPAYDITYSYNPNGAWTSRHQMTINTKRDQFSREDFRAVAKATSMKRGRDTAIIEEVRAAVMRWREFADAAGVDATWAEEIGRNLRLDL
jgi:serine/threonine-protein kinase HipA